MAPKYVGPYEILEKKGPNTYKLVDQEGDIEDLVHVEYLKSFFAEKGPEDDEEIPDRNQVGDEDDSARPPREEEMAMSDPPLARTQPPAGVGSDQDEVGVAAQARGSGRPRKTAIVTRRPAEASPVSTNLVTEVETADRKVRRTAY